MMKKGEKLLLLSSSPAFAFESVDLQQSEGKRCGKLVLHRRCGVYFCGWGTTGPNQAKHHHRLYCCCRGRFVLMMMQHLPQM